MDSAQCSQGWGPRVCVSSKLPGEARIAGSQKPIPGSWQPREPLSQELSGFKEWELSRAITHNGASLEEIWGASQNPFAGRRIGKGKLLGSCRQTHLSRSWVTWVIVRTAPGTPPFMCPSSSGSLPPSDQSGGVSISSSEPQLERGLGAFSDRTHSKGWSPLVWTVDPLRRGSGLCLPHPSQGSCVRLLPVP